MSIKDKVNLDTIIKGREDIDVTDIDGEKAMMDIENGKYFILNEVGSRMWEIIDKPIKINDIINILIDEYDIDFKKCEETVMEFIGNLKNASLIHIC